MLRRLFDLNRTIRHVSYREMRQRHERDQRRTEKLWKLIIAGTTAAMIILVIAGLVLR